MHFVSITNIITLLVFIYITYFRNSKNLIISGNHSWSQPFNNSDAISRYQTHHRPLLEEYETLLFDNSFATTSFTKVIIILEYDFESKNCDSTWLGLEWVDSSPITNPEWSKNTGRTPLIPNLLAKYLYILNPGSTILDL